MAIAQPTIQIDPTSGLIAYVQAIKPYHSKILDVLVEYVVSDSTSVTLAEEFDLTIINHAPSGDVIYTCGFGTVWNPYSMTNPALLPHATIDSMVSDPENKFTVTMPEQTPVSIVVSSLKANQFAMVQPSTITGVNALTMTWTVMGNVTSTMVAGATFYISSNHPSANGMYTVGTSTYNSGSNTTQVTSVEPISLLAVPSGKFNVPIKVDDLPYWPPSLAVKLVTTGTMPAPLDSSTTYYFSPSLKLGLFNLSLKRYPQTYNDIIDITTGGIGELTIVRAEPFVPGEYVDVVGTIGSDGQYTVESVEPIDQSTFVVKVLQRVQDTEEVVENGTMTYFGSYGDPYCPIADAPPLHAETYIYERLDFDFGPVEPS